MPVHPRLFDLAGFLASTAAVLALCWLARRLGRAEGRALGRREALRVDAPHAPPAPRRPPGRGPMAPEEVAAWLDRALLDNPLSLPALLEHRVPFRADLAAGGPPAVLQGGPGDPGPPGLSALGLLNTVLLPAGRVVVPRYGAGTPLGRVTVGYEVRVAAGCEARPAGAAGGPAIIGDAGRG
jgi:hypothetical protein